MKSTSYTKLIIALSLAISSFSIPFANADVEENDAMQIKKTKISLVQAIQIAENATDGRAAQAELEESKVGWVFDVEVVSGRKVFEVKVDPNTGKILSKTLDEEDDDEEEEDKKD